MDLSDRALYELDLSAPLSTEVVEFLVALVQRHQEQLPGYQRKVLTPVRDDLVRNLHLRLRIEDPAASENQLVTRLIERVKLVERHPPKSWEGCPGWDIPELLWLIRSAAPMPKNRQVKNLLAEASVQ